MRLLFIYRYGILGGVVTQLINRYAFLRDHVDVHFAFVRDYGGCAALPHGTTVVLPAPRARREYFRSQQFDVIADIDTPEVIADLDAVGFSGLLTYEVHTTTENLAKSMPIVRKMPAINLMLTPSEYLRQRILGEFGFAGWRDVKVIANCLDTELFKGQPVEAADHPIVIWVGKLDAHKNWLGFLDICERVAWRHPDAEFWLVGGQTAPEVVGVRFFEELRLRNLTAQTRWLPRVEYSDMPRLYSYVAASGGCLVSTSTDESFGMTVHEALACGCPVAAASVGALPELLCGELNSMLFGFDDADAAAKVVSSFAVHRDASSLLVADGIKRVRERCSIEGVGKRYLEFLNQARLHRGVSIVA